MKLIDTHAHLDQIEHIDEVLVQCETAGVEAIVAVSVDLSSSKKNLQLRGMGKMPHISPAMGIHPGEIKPAEIDEAMVFFEEHIQEVCAIGEIGLDFWYRWVRKDESKKAEQREVFCRQLDLAKKYDLPVVIHSRGAWAECLALAKSHGPRKAVFHWYSGPVDVLKDILDAGFFISATPSLAYSPQAREAVSNAPITQTLIETDCPVFFRADENDPGFRATPKDVFRTFETYVALKKIDSLDAAKTLTANAKQFFKIP